MPVSMKDSERSFTVVESSFGLNGGRYVAEDPMTGAHHAVRQLFRRADNGKARGGRKSNTVTVKLQEITRIAGAKHKTYVYRATRTRKPADQIKPQTFTKPDGTKVQFTAEWDYNVKSVGGDALGSTASAQ